MFKQEIKSASVPLLRFLNQMSAFPNEEPDAKSPIPRRTNVVDYREDMDKLAHQLEQCSWGISVLLSSLDEMKETRRLLKRKQGKLLGRVNRFIAAKPRSIHFPNEILSLIAGFVYLEPLRICNYNKKRSSTCRWVRNTLKASSAVVDDGFFFLEELDLLPSILSASPPYTFAIHLDKLIPKTKPLQRLLPSRERWSSLRFGPGGHSSIVDFGNALLGASCPNCPRPNDHQTTKCADHNVLTSLKAFCADHKLIPVFGGLLKNIRQLGLEITGVDQPTIPLNFSELVNWAPLLTELTISWWSHKDPKPSPGTEPQAYFPNLTRVVFIEKQFTELERLSPLKFAFGSLNGTSVKDLSVHFMQFGDCDFECDDQPKIMKFLGKSFPSVSSLSLRVEPNHNGSFPLEMLKSQRNLLKTLIPASTYEKTKFRHLTHLAIEVEANQEGLSALVRVLIGRRDFRGTTGSLPEIRSLELFETLDSVDQGESIDFLTRVQGCVQDVTICQPKARWW